MTCKGRDKDIALYLAGDLDAARASRLEEHLSRCPACAASERAFRRNAEALGELANARLDRPAEESFHRQVVALLRSGDGAAPVPLPLLNRRRTTTQLAMATCALVAVMAGVAYVLIREARPVRNPMKRSETVARRVPPPPSFAPSVLPSAAGGAPSKAASPVVTRSIKVPSQMAKRAVRTKNTRPQKGEEALVIRLQTDDPDVVIYWQLQNRGG